MLKPGILMFCCNFCFRSSLTEVKCWEADNISVFTLRTSSRRPVIIKTGSSPETGVWIYVEDFARNNFILEPKSQTYNTLTVNSLFILKNYYIDKNLTKKPKYKQKLRIKKKFNIKLCVISSDRLRQWMTYFSKH